MTKSPGARSRIFSVPTPEITAICSCTKPSRSSLMPRNSNRQVVLLRDGFLRCSVHLFLCSKGFQLYLHSPDVQIEDPGCTATFLTCKSSPRIVRSTFLARKSSPRIVQPASWRANRVPGSYSLLPGVQIKSPD